MVVFRVPNRRHVLRRNLQFLQHVRQAGGLVDAAGKHHDGPLVKDNVVFDP